VLEDAVLEIVVASGPGSGESIAGTSGRGRRSGGEADAWVRSLGMGEAGVRVRSLAVGRGDARVRTPERARWGSARGGTRRQLAVARKQDER
jgi:hypothetical protein